MMVVLGTERHCVNCGGACQPHYWRRQRCPACYEYQRRHGADRAPRPPQLVAPVDDGARVMWTVESYGAGWYVYARGQWWQVPAHRNGWQKRKPSAAAPPEGLRVRDQTASKWLPWLGVPA